MKTIIFIAILLGISSITWAQNTPSQAPLPTPLSTTVYDLVNIFGTPHPVQTPAPTSTPCVFVAEKNPILADNLDSTVVWLTDVAGNLIQTPQTVQIISSTDYKDFKNVHYPVRVKSSLPGQWKAVIITPGMQSCSITIMAQ